MAKKDVDTFAGINLGSSPKLLNKSLTERTEPKPGAAAQIIAMPVPQGRRNKPIGVYLKAEQKLALAKIATQLDVSRHMVLTYMITHFIDQHAAGKLKLRVVRKGTKLVLTDQ